MDAPDDVFVLINFKPFLSLCTEAFRSDTYYFSLLVSLFTLLLFSVSDLGFILREKLRCDYITELTVLPVLDCAFEVLVLLTGVYVLISLSE